VLASEKDFIVVGTAENGDEVISEVLALGPDVVLMDIDMPGLSCFDAIQIIRFRLPDNMKFILVTAHENDEHLEQALRVKANEFVTKHEGVAAHHCHMALRGHHNAEIASGDDEHPVEAGRPRAPIESQLTNCKFPTTRDVANCWICVCPLADGYVYMSGVRATWVANHARPICDCR
jgi:DNA-binding NarL/FixJ family response regulator